MPERQTTSNVLMIAPTRFCGNEQTSSSNRFQNLGCIQNDAQLRARAEFEGLVSVLSTAGVRVHCFDDTLEPHTPDSIFPNNWVSFHADGSAVLYPMLAPNRRLERRSDILESLNMEQRFRIKQLVDLTHRESESKFLEGTGSLVLDRLNRLAYACLSSRTDLDTLGEFAQILDYEIIAFDAVDRSGTPIYHTNVMLSIGTEFAVLCSDSIAESQRTSVIHSLRSTAHTVIDITHQQMESFAGNILELSTVTGDRVIAMSEQAENAFTSAQRAQLIELGGAIVSAPIPTIETLGGGSVRCMLAEVHLPRAND
jgi:hypothetical protein